MILRCRTSNYPQKVHFRLGTILRKRWPGQCRSALESMIKIDGTARISRHAWQAYIVPGCAPRYIRHSGNYASVLQHCMPSRAAFETRRFALSYKTNMLFKYTDRLNARSICLPFQRSWRYLRELTQCGQIREFCTESLASVQMIPTNSTAPNLYSFVNHVLLTKLYGCDFPRCHRTLKTE